MILFSCAFSAASLSLNLKINEDKVKIKGENEDGERRKPCQVTEKMSPALIMEENVAAFQPNF